MKRSIYLIGLSMAIFGQIKAQSTLVLQPGSEEGKDAILWSTQENGNFANVESNTAYTWTNSGDLGVKRALVEFDFSTIPSNVTITSASLSLYYNPTSSNESFDFHTGTNDIYIERVNSAWEEGTVTWSNQPSTSPINQVSLPPSTTQTEDYVNIDVTDLVVDMNDPLIGNHGFLIRMADEIYYHKSVLFASSDHPEASLHPKLEITYTEDLEGCNLLRPNADLGKDAIVWSTQEDENFANVESNTAYAWSNNGALGVKRVFLGFDFSMIPANATVTGASLSLYYNPTDADESFDFHYGSNDIYIERVISEWDENTITWSNQPSASNDNQVSLPPSTVQTQDYVNVDVTDMVVEMNDPLNGNHGFMIRMADESNYYKSVLFASSDHPVDSLHPQIEICWEVNALSTNGDNQMNIDFQVFPNPSSGSFELRVPNNDIRNYKVEVFDLMGKMIQEYKKMDNYIDLDEMGVYFIRISDSIGNYATKKVIVQ